MYNAIINDIYRSTRNNDDTRMKNALLCAVMTGSIVTFCCKKILSGKALIFNVSFSLTFYTFYNILYYISSHTFLPSEMFAILRSGYRSYDKFTSYAL